MRHKMSKSVYCNTNTSPSLVLERYCWQHIWPHIKPRLRENKNDVRISHCSKYQRTNWKLLMAIQQSSTPNLPVYIWQRRRSDGLYILIVIIIIFNFLGWCNGRLFLFLLSLLSIFFCLLNQGVIELSSNSNRYYSLIEQLK